MGEEGGTSQKKNFKDIIKNAMKDLKILWQYSGTDDIFLACFRSIMQKEKP